MTKKVEKVSIFLQISSKTDFTNKFKTIQIAKMTKSFEMTKKNHKLGHYKYMTENSELKQQPGRCQVLLPLPKVWGLIQKVSDKHPKF